MYIVSQIYHDYDPDTHDALHTEFIDEYTIHSIFKDFDKAVKYAKQLNQDFEIDCVCNRLKIKYEYLKQAIAGLFIVQASYAGEVANKATIEIQGKVVQKTNTVPSTAYHQEQFVIDEQHRIDVKTFD